MEEAAVNLRLQLRQSIVDPQPVPLILQETGVQQIPKVTRGLGLGDAEEALDLTDAQLAVTEHEREDLEAEVLRKGFEFLSEVGH
jgi:hypothetical protein